jgi:hypothetical protein
LDSAREKAARGHLRLAEGLIRTVVLGDTASEYEIRNAFSRAYYALFHVCGGYLWASTGIDVEKVVRDHGQLRHEMGRWMGRSFERFLGDVYELRRQADYRPEWSPPPVYWCAEKLKQARKHLYAVMFAIPNRTFRGRP